MATVAELVEALAGRLDCPWHVEPDDETYTLEVEEDGEPVPITIYADAVGGDDTDAEASAGVEVLVLRARAAEGEDEADFVPLFRAVSGCWFARAYFETPEDEDDVAVVVMAEAALPLQGLAIDIAAMAVDEVVALATADETLTDTLDDDGLTDDLFDDSDDDSSTA